VAHIVNHHPQFHTAGRRPVASGWCSGTSRSAGSWTPPLEATWQPATGELVLDAIDTTGPDGIVCLTGVSSAGRTLTIDPGALNRELVLENELVFGTVNANRRHDQAAAAGLAKADQSWLERLVSRRVPLERWSDALQRRPDDVKAVIDPGG
jgi:glucose 1-dehydrogenase